MPALWNKPTLLVLAVYGFALFCIIYLVVKGIAAILRRWRRSG